MKQLNLEQMEQAHRFSDWLFLTTRQASYHCQVAMPVLKRWLRNGRPAALKTPGGYCRIALEELQCFLRQYGRFLYPTSTPYICNFLESLLAVLEVSR